MEMSNLKIKIGSEEEQTIALCGGEVKLPLAKSWNLVHQFLKELTTQVAHTISFCMGKIQSFSGIEFCVFDEDEISRFEDDPENCEIREELLEEGEMYSKEVYLDKLYEVNKRNLDPSLRFSVTFNLLNFRVVLEHTGDFINERVVYIDDKYNEHILLESDIDSMVIWSPEGKKLLNYSVKKDIDQTITKHKNLGELYYKLYNLRSHQMLSVAPQVFCEVFSQMDSVNSANEHIESLSNNVLNTILPAYALAAQFAASLEVEEDDTTITFKSERK